MSQPRSATEIEDRLRIAERAIADMNSRIGELTHALADMAEFGGETETPQAEPVTIGADTVSPFCVGFYQREYDAADRPYRWTGRGNLFELRFRLNRSFEWDFSMELQQNAHVDVGRLRGFVDYLEIPLKVSSSDGAIRGVIPARPFGRHAVLTFLLPNLFVPNQINPESTDSRTLGVVFYELRAIPTILSKEIGSAEPGPSGAKDSRLVLEEGLQGAGLLRKARSSLAAGMARPKKVL